MFLHKVHAISGTGEKVLYAVIGLYFTSYFVEYTEMLIVLYCILVNTSRLFVVHRHVIRTRTFDSQQPTN